MLLGLAISVVTVNSFLGRINNLQKDFEIETPKTEITKEFEMPQPKKLSPVKPVIVEEFIAFIPLSFKYLQVEPVATISQLFSTNFFASERMVSFLNTLI